MYEGRFVAGNEPLLMLIACGALRAATCLARLRTGSIPGLFQARYQYLGVFRQARHLGQFLSKPIRILGGRVVVRTRFE